MKPVINTISNSPTGSTRLHSFRLANSELAYLDGSGRYYAGTGTTALPTFSFLADTNTGFNNPSDNVIDFIANGAIYGSLSTAGLNFNVYNAYDTGQPVSFKGKVADGGTAIGIKLGNTVSLTTAGAKIVAFYSDNVTTEKASITKDGLGNFVGVTLTADSTVSNGGSNTNSYKLFLKANSGGTVQTASFATMYGADPYLRVSVPNDSGTETAVLDIHDTVLACVADNSIDIGTSSGNRPKDIYNTGKIVLDADASYGGGVTKQVATVQTTDGNATTIWTSPVVADDEAYDVEVVVTGMKNDGTKRALYHLHGLFYRDGGNVSQQGSTASIVTIESDAAWDCDFSMDTGNQQILLRVTGEATSNFKAEVTYKKVTAS